jgi:hypothetical protein
VLTILCNPIDNNFVEEDLEHLVKQHINDLKQYRCKTPQSMVVNSSSLLKNISDYVAIPYQTVIHRCSESSGCCKEHHICKDKNKESKTLVFKLKKINSHESAIYKAISVENHTECHCVRRKYRDDDDDD